MELRQPDGADDCITRALAEDVGGGDATTLALVPEGLRLRARIECRGPVVVCGGGIAAGVFRRLDPDVRLTDVRAEGEHAAAGSVVMRVEGSARAILTGERTALNLMQRLSGIATLTRRFVDLLAPYGTTVLDTRKTTPGLRALEKYAVACGGGRNHRMGLYDQILIKDNHRRLWALGGGAGGLGAAVREARRRYPGLKVEIEVETEAELDEVLPERPDWVLLDNMPVDLMRRCVAKCRGLTRTEASGGITLENAAAAGATGVDAISLGCLTHSAPAVDLSLEVEDVVAHA